MAQPEGGLPLKCHRSRKELHAGFMPAVIEFQDRSLKHVPRTNSPEGNIPACHGAPCLLQGSHCQLGLTLVEGHLRGANQH